MRFKGARGLLLAAQGWMHLRQLITLFCVSSSDLFDLDRVYSIPRTHSAQRAGGAARNSSVDTKVNKLVRQNAKEKRQVTSFCPFDQG